MNFERCTDPKIAMNVGLMTWDKIENIIHSDEMVKDVILSLNNIQIPIVSFTLNNPFSQYFPNYFYRILPTWVYKILKVLEFEMKFLERPEFLYVERIQPYKGTIVLLARVYFDIKTYKGISLKDPNHAAVSYLYSIKIIGSIKKFKKHFTIIQDYEL